MRVWDFSTTAALVAANIVISALRNIIPARVRLPGEIVVVASLVTIVDMLMEGFTPSLYSALGIYIPLIVVKLSSLGYAEALRNERTSPSFLPLTVLEWVLALPSR